jgi:hypothetical protein
MAAALLEYFKRLAARFDWRRIELPPDPPDPPDDPFAGVRHPVKRPPGGRSSAIALEEPHER